MRYLTPGLTLRYPPYISLPPFPRREPGEWDNSSGAVNLLVYDKVTFQNQENHSDLPKDGFALFKHEKSKKKSHETTDLIYGFDTNTNCRISFDY